MRIVGRHYGRAAKGSGASSIIKNSKAVGTIVPPVLYGTQRTCANPVAVDGCSKAANVDAPTVVESGYGLTRKNGSTIRVIKNSREVGTTVFPQKPDWRPTCNPTVENKPCSKADNLDAPAVVERTYGSTRKNGAAMGVIKNSREVGTTVFPAKGDTRLTCRSWKNAHLR